MTNGLEGTPSRDNDAPRGDAACFSESEKIVSKTFIQAIAIGAMLLSPTLASARVASVGVSTHVGSVGVVRADAKPPRIHSNVKLLNCEKIERHNPYNDTVIYRTVCH
jgi:hypothetical protein